MHLSEHAGVHLSVAAGLYDQPWMKVRSPEVGTAVYV